MPIIAVIFLTLAFWVIYWFVRMGGIDHFRERAVQRKEEARRGQTRELERTAQLRAVDDPRDAATVLMLLIPRGGDPTSEQSAAIDKIVRDAFDFDGQLLARMTQARFIAGRAENFDQATKVFSGLLKKRLTEDERLQLVTMVEQVAHYDGPTQTQLEAITLLKQRLGLAAAS